MTYQFSLLESITLAHNPLSAINMVSCNVIQGVLIYPDKNIADVYRK